jgi:hypothetical protein
MRSERKKDRYTLLPERLFTELRKYYREYLPRYWLFEGIDLRYIQELLGHASTKTAEVYTRVASNALMKIKNLLDTIFTQPHPPLYLYFTYTIQIREKSEYFTTYLYNIPQIRGINQL